MRTVLHSAIGALALTLAASLPAIADEPPKDSSDGTLEAGVRYWFSQGNSEFTLYDSQLPVNRVSALHYEHSASHSAEAYMRIDLNNHLFLNAVGSYGKVADGELNDEDFPPFIAPYSSTLSELTGKLDFFALDVGYNFLDEKGGENPHRLGAFIGYNYLHEEFDAHGCTQIGPNPGICVPGDTSRTVYINEDNDYKNFRFGLSGQVRISPKMSLAAEGAYLIVDHDNLDTHFFTFGPLGAEGDGTGFQLESMLTYDIYEQSNIGIGARYWEMNTDVYLDGSLQLETYSVTRYGVFVQAGVKFN